MNKKELIEELNRTNTEYDEIRFAREFKIPENVNADLARVKRKLDEFSKFMEELLCDWHNVTYMQLVEKLDEVIEEHKATEESLDEMEHDEASEFIIDKVVHTNRRDESGAHFKTIILSD